MLEPDYSLTIRKLQQWADRLAPQEGSVTS
jgi:hypothetical protein